MQPIFYKLSADPFRLSPDHRFCFPHRSYRKAMIYMRHALFRAEGFIIITGQPGMGKTTLINDLLRGLRQEQIRVARLVSTQLLADDLLRLVAYDLSLDPAGMDKASILNRMDQFFRQQYREGRRTLLVVDEAQDVTAEALEELRLLTNLQVDGQQLLQIFLVGQEELRDTVSDPSLVQLHQRVIATTHLEPLDAIETREYIKHRLRRVGWEGDPLISNQVYEMIQQFSRGIPRQINQICSRLILHGSIEERHRLGLHDLKTVIEELHGEMLLPPGMQEIADTVQWPADSQQETYDERSRNGKHPLSKDSASLVDDTPPDRSHIQQEATRHRVMSDSTAESTDTDMRVEGPSDDGPTATATATATVSSTDNARPDTIGREMSEAAGSRRPERIARRPGPRHLLAVAALLSSLLFALLITLDNDTGSRFRKSLATLIHHNFQGLAGPEPATTTGQRTGETTPGETPASNQGMAVDRADSATVIRPTVAADTRPADDVVVNEITDTHREVAETATAVVAAQETRTQTGRTEEMPVFNEITDTHREVAETATAVVAAQETGAQTGRAEEMPVFSEIEAELADSGLLVERLDDDSLKVNLSGDGLFEFNSTRISDSAGATLARLATILGRHEKVDVQVVGHTDSSGQPEYNLFLSRRRAKAVADYLLEEGLPENRIQFEGRGDLDTRNEEATRNQPDLRRRVEVYLRPLQQG